MAAKVQACLFEFTRRLKSSQEIDEQSLANQDTEVCYYNNNIWSGKSATANSA